METEGFLLLLNFFVEHTNEKTTPKDLAHGSLLMVLGRSSRSSLSGPSFRLRVFRRSGDGVGATPANREDGGGVWVRDSGQSLIVAMPTDVIIN